MARGTGAFGALVACSLAAAGPGVAAADDASELLLPDLRQQVPQGLQIEVVQRGRAPRVRLGFRSAAENVGTGPLEIHGHRRDRSRLRMQADQLVARADGSVLRRRGVSALRYVKLGDHRHWHLDRFMSYELRDARSFRLVRGSPKVGFCLGDRYNLDIFTDMPNEPPAGVFTRECGLRRPDLLNVHEGISVGHVDYYAAHLEGQHIDVTTVRNGRYWLVHRVDPGNRLLELDETNNASALLVHIRFTPMRGGGRRIRVTPLWECEGVERCARPNTGPGR